MNPIDFCSPQALIQLQNDRRVQLLDKLSEALITALDIASQLNLPGKELADEVLYACDYCDYQGFRLTDFIGRIFDYGGENALMPLEYYTLLKFKYAVTEAVKMFDMPDLPDGAANA